MPTFTPKLNWNPNDVNNPYYTTYNLYYGPAPHTLWMPNCTAWAAGRGNEVGNIQNTSGWPNNDGKGWYADGIAMGLQGTTQFVPQLGACVCFDTPPELPNGGGHVAIIEEIHTDANNNVDYVRLSNSFYDANNRTPQNAYPFFFMGTLYASDLNHIYCDNGYILYQPFQGILYNPLFPPGPIPPGPTPVVHKKIPIWAVSLPNRIRRYYGNRI